MGCRTGFYLLLVGDYESADIVPLLQEMFLFIRDFEGDVPGAAARDCGNYLDMNLPMAKYLAGKFYDEVLENIREEQLVLSGIRSIMKFGAPKIQQTRMNMVRFFHLREAGIHSYVPMGDLALLQNCVFDEHLRR